MNLTAGQEWILYMIFWWVEYRYPCKYFFGTKKMWALTPIQLVSLSLFTVVELGLD
jgi:hypothetical protein